MFGRVLSALFSVVGWAVKFSVTKAILFFGIYYVVYEFTGVIVDYLPTASILNNAFQGINGDVAYFLTFFQIPAGLTMLLSAYVTRFMIRRIPFIG